jgi:transcriptional regulator with XRE-family HTH domain
MTFAEKLRQLRQTAGLSEAGLAERSGVSFGAIHNYGLGLRKPTFSCVLRLARALGVTCQAFAECEDLGAETNDGPAAGRRRPPRSAGQALADDPPTRQKKKRTE